MHGQSRRQVLLAGLGLTLAACGARRPTQAYRYIVSEGDTLSLVSERSGLSVGTIITANQLRTRTLLAGQVLWLPGVTRLGPVGTPPPPRAPREGAYRLVKRAEWQAATLRDNYDPMGAITRITVHHTSEIPGIDHLSDRELVAKIQRNHQQHQQWADIGYHYLIGRAGEVFEGRPLFAQGAHAGGDSNKHNIGVALIGDFDQQLPDTRQLAILERLLEELRQRYHIPRDQVFGHRDFKTTVCPGQALYHWLETWRQSAIAHHRH